MRFEVGNVEDSDSLTHWNEQQRVSVLRYVDMELARYKGKRVTRENPERV